MFTKLGRATWCKGQVNIRLQRLRYQLSNFESDHQIHKIEIDTIKNKILNNMLIDLQVNN